MLNILIWIVYGLIVGLISKSIYRYKDSPKGFAATLAIGVCGSFVGGLINHLAGNGPFQASGLIMGVLGGVITCFLYRKFVIEQIKKDLR